MDHDIGTPPYPGLIDAFAAKQVRRYAAPSRPGMFTGGTPGEDSGSFGRTVACLAPLYVAVVALDVVLAVLFCHVGWAIAVTV